MSTQENLLFEELKEIRLQKGLSLEEISSTTRIHIKYLQSLEKGNIIEIPEIYDKLFFKSYLRSLQLKESDYYQKFLNYRNTVREDKTSVLDLSNTEDNKQQKKNYKQIIYFIPLIAVAIVVWFLLENTLLVSNNMEPVEEIDLREVAKRLEIDEKKDSVVVDSGKVKKRTRDLLKLTIKGLKKTWLRVVVDRKDTLEYLLAVDDKVDLQAKEYFEFLIGKSRGVSLTLGNKEYGPFGEEGQVVKYMSIDSTGITSQKLGYPKTSQRNNDER